MLLATDRGANVRDALAGHDLAAPAHFDAEVFRALRRARRRRLLTASDLSARLRLLASLAAERVPLPPLLASADALGERFSAPDSLYVALAQVIGAQLVTCDAGLARACTGLVSVRLVSAP